MNASEKGIAAERVAEELGEQARDAENSRLNVAPVFDLAARRAARPIDAGSIIRSLEDDVAALYTSIASWPFVYLRESHLIGAERHLVELQRLLIDLRAFVPATGE